MGPHSTTKIRGAQVRPGTSPAAYPQQSASIMTVWGHWRTCCNLDFFILKLCGPPTYTNSPELCQKWFTSYLIVSERTTFSISHGSKSNKSMRIHDLFNPFQLSQPTRPNPCIRRTALSLCKTKHSNSEATLQPAVPCDTPCLVRLCHIQSPLLDYCDNLSGTASNFYDPHMQLSSGIFPSCTFWHKD